MFLVHSCVVLGYAVKAEPSLSKAAEHHLSYLDYPTAGQLRSSMLGEACNG